MGNMRRVSPSHYGTTGTAREEPDLPHFPSTLFEDNRLAEALEHLAGLSQFWAQYQYPVDERRVQTLPGDSESSITLQPTYEFPEFIKTVVVTGPAAPVSTFQVSNAVTNPAANGVIASLGVIPKGSYTASVELELQGTVTNADANNMKFVTQGLGLIANFSYPGQVGVYQIPPFDFSADGTTTVAVKAVAAASGISAVYAANVVATPNPVTFTLQLGDRVWNLVLPSTGILAIPVDSISLDRTDARILTPAVAGDWGLELVGWGDVRERRQ
jgi:hypothetical protein